MWEQSAAFFIEQYCGFGLICDGLHLSQNAAHGVVVPTGCTGAIGHADAASYAFVFSRCRIRTF
jgi:hypothetical protein